MDKVTIITVCYNAEAEIEKTMRSVCEQDYLCLEYLVIDGASKDATLEIVDKVKKEYNDKNGLVICVTSDKDNGIYDAMNKGIKLASGEWILFMNAGDTFFKNTTVSDVIRESDHSEQLSGIYGNTVRVRDGKQRFVEGKPLEAIRDNFSLPFCHQSIFVRRALLLRYHFDLRYKHAGDYNFFVKAYLDGNVFHHVDCTVSVYLMGGVSEINNVKHWAEKIQIREENGLECFSTIKKVLIISKYSVRQKIKKLIPKNLLKYIVR